mgnify:CR=1 FL=1
MNIARTFFAGAFSVLALLDAGSFLVGFFTSAVALFLLSPDLAAGSPSSSSASSSSSSAGSDSAAPAASSRRYCSCSAIHSLGCWAQAYARYSPPSVFLLSPLLRYASISCFGNGLTLAGVGGNQELKDTISESATWSRSCLQKTYYSPAVMY